jgi:hypothetical protein
MTRYTCNEDAKEDEMVERRCGCQAVSLINQCNKQHRGDGWLGIWVWRGEVRTLPHLQHQEEGW